jgi:hypothetical protein
MGRLFRKQYLLEGDQIIKKKKGHRYDKWIKFKKYLYINKKKFKKK